MKHPDYNSPAELKQVLDINGFSMQKKFGQNFLINSEARKKLIDTLQVDENTSVWEVGPGLGAMTCEILKRGAKLVVLIKPQFEAGREKVGKKGVVRDQSVHEEVIVLVMNYAISIGFEPIKLDYSPIKGPEGNIEYLLYIKKNPEKIAAMEAAANSEDEETQDVEGNRFDDSWMQMIEETVKRSHELL